MKVGRMEIQFHTAANTALEMGGSLTVRSDGVGRGAIFTITLGVRTPTAKAAANAS